MSNVIMNMSQGNIERAEPVTVEYGDEIMCSGWNPALAMTQLVPEDKHRSFPAELLGVDLESFLHKMYG
ncbi:MAG TPA: hypothetical protein VMV48_15150 [Gallionellaceae bacterium]|nr:hypothetical protein [Gallionellaceae bacterium]